MNVNMSATDVDYIDPSLAYGTVSWQILDSICVRSSMYYPDKPDPLGSKLAPDGAVGFPARLEGRQDVRLHVKSGDQVEHG